MSNQFNQFKMYYNIIDIDCCAYMVLFHLNTLPARLVPNLKMVLTNALEWLNERVTGYLYFLFIFFKCFGSYFMVEKNGLQ